MSVAALGIGNMVFVDHVTAAEWMFFEGDMVRGPTKAGRTGPTCVLTSQYKRKEKVVWRVRVFDPKSREQIGKKGLKSLVVHLSDGQKFPTHFGTHPRKKPTDRFWTTSWEIPENYPTGSFSYKVVATDLQGKEHTWQPFKVGLSQLSVIPGTVTFIK